MERKNCTKDDLSQDYMYHPDAREVGDQEDGWPGGDIVTYECPHCGHDGGRNYHNDK